MFFTLTLGFGAERASERARRERAPSQRRRQQHQQVAGDRLGLAYLNEREQVRARSLKNAVGYSTRSLARPVEVGFACESVPVPRERTTIAMGANSRSQFGSRAQQNQKQKQKQKQKERSHSKT